MDSLLAVTFPATVPDAVTVFAQVERYCQEHGVEEQLGHRLRVVLEEVISNIVLHGYSPQSKGVIELTVHSVGHGIFVTVVDDGKAFDLLSHQTVDVSDLISSSVIGSLGINLIKSLCDEICYERRSERNRISFRMLEA